jgi:hypothetical protein
MPEMGLSRPTADIDYCSAVPANLNLTEMSGEGSVLARKYKVWPHRVAVMTMPLILLLVRDKLPGGLIRFVFYRDGHHLSISRASLTFSYVSSSMGGRMLSTFAAV